MSPESLYPLLNAAVVPAWLLLVAAPRWRGTQWIVHAVWIPLLLGAVYGILALTSEQPEGAGFGSIAAVQAAFSSPGVLLAGWVHYLVFDLFVGAWQVRDAGRRGVPHVAVVPCLVLTFAMGPVGLLLYLLLRAGWTRTWTLAEDG